MSFLWAKLQDITVQNCVGYRGGAVSGYETGLYLDNTRWINNTAIEGGAIRIYWGEITMDTSTNYFINNSASGCGGALAGDYASFIHYNPSKDFFSGNEAPDDSANVCVDNTSSLRYPEGGSPPPLTNGTVMVSPKVYVDGSVDCASVTCDGSAQRPYGTLRNLTLSWVGGTIYVMPGLYTGFDNVNLTIANANTILQRWPNTTGQVVMDCQGLAPGFFLYNLAISISDFTIQNCFSNSAVGGGAMEVQFALLSLTDVDFINNTAVGSGGAVFAYATQLTIVRGSFQDNTSYRRGGALRMSSSIGWVQDGVVFTGNRVNNVSEDLSCTNADLQNDGSVTLGVGTADSSKCFVAVQSPSTSALFPGSLNGILWPKNSAGAVQSDLFASLNFGSIVELDASGTAIESTRLNKADLDWTMTVTNRSDSITLQYDAFGSANQYIGIIHTFFKTDGTYFPVGSPEAMEVSEGTIKTSVQVAMWPFQSSRNSLALTLFVNTTSPLTEMSQQTSPAGGSTEFIFKTADVTVSFSALQSAVYDSVLNAGTIDVTAQTYPTSVAFEFVFSSFGLWMAYDPEFGVLLGGTETSGNRGDGGVSLSLILGLSIGLGGGALLVVVFVVVIGGAIVTVLRSRKRRKVLKKVSTFNKTNSYFRLQEQNTDQL